MKESSGQGSVLFIILAVVVCLALGLMVGFLWGILLLVLAVLVIKKASGGPADGYCMANIRKKLPLSLFWLLIFLLGVGGVFYVWNTYPKTLWEWGETIGGILVSFIAVALGAYQMFVILRGAFFPEKSTLARSIRAHLDFPDQAPGVAELFSIVDNDIAQNGTWFGPLAVGKEWVLGDEASRLDRVRGIFYVAHIHRHHGSNRAQTSRTFELILMDDRRQTQTTDFSKKDDWEGAFLFLKERLPEAFYGTKTELKALLEQTEEEWHQIQQEFEKRRAQREHG